MTNPHDSDRSREPNGGTGLGPRADAAVILGELVTSEYDGLPVGLFRDLAGEEIPLLISSASWPTLATPGLVLALSGVRR